ncbi:MAG: 23S rRNA (guanosine(2251)-2'-O)-methyltransferase RlmB [Hyphomicrobiaceae bacterium]|nr:23S rRNA (guanosine(2251)-2'-O)-methyltransferase RlmB [Hyphomicrobiaceae bacterium]
MTANERPGSRFSSRPARTDRDRDLRPDDKGEHDAPWRRTADGQRSDDRRDPHPEERSANRAGPREGSQEARPRDGFAERPSRQRSDDRNNRSRDDRPRDSARAERSERQERPDPCRFGERGSSGKSSYWKGGVRQGGRTGGGWSGKPGGFRPRPHRTASLDLNDGVIRLYGLHAVEAALSNAARPVKRIVATDNAARKLEAAIKVRGLTVDPTTPRDLDKLLGSDTVHQGVMIEADALPEPELAELAAAALAQRKPLIVLDQVTDPHNAGAVLRSAAVFGAAGIVMTRRHSPPLNGTLAKSASGALELVPIALVQNLARALAELRESGMRIVALDGDGTGLLEDEPFDGGIAIVLGAEGRGLRQSTKEAADAVVRIATGGALDSLNVSNAAAIALHLSAMRRRSRAE